MRRVYAVALVGVLVGAFTLNPLIVIDLPFGRLRVNDIIIVTQALYAGIFFLSRRGRDILSSNRDLSRIVFVFFAMILLMVFNSHAERTAFGGNEFLANLRRSLYFGSFFLVRPLLRSANDVRFLARLLLTFATIGSCLVILQSIAGPDPLFGAMISAESDMHSYFNVSTWNQFDPIGGLLTRVNLPINYLIVWSLFFALFSFLKNPRFIVIPFLLLFGIAVFINYARGLFFGIGLAFVVSFFRDYRKRKAHRVSFIPIVTIASCILLLFVAIAVTYEIDIISLAQSRVSSALEDLVSNQGTWQFRMEEVADFQSLEITPVDILLGYGLFPQNSPLGIGYIHFGLADLLYRGGVIFGLWLVVYVILLVKYLIRFERIPTNVERLMASRALLFYTIAMIGFFVSSNHFWADYSAATVGIVLAIVHFQDDELEYVIRETPANGSSENM